jgi:hypothetical protein
MLQLEHMPDHARVWVYQSSRILTDAETLAIQQRLHHFVQQWLSHQKALKACAEIRYQQFIVLAVDQQYESPSGCSIDSSVAFLKSIENDFEIDLFDRLHFAWKATDTQIRRSSRREFAELYAQGQISDQTIVFNNLVNTKKDLLQHWEIELSKSWHAKMV